MRTSGKEKIPKAFFLSTRHGPCFCLIHEPQGMATKGNILCFHAFAEELNTTRRIVAHQARKLAQLGYRVLQIDLIGCGDSNGNFENASWSVWLENMHEAFLWLKKDSTTPIWFWGIRAGAILATSLINQLQNSKQEPVHLLFWQPVITGQQMLQQFLRLRNAAEWMGTHIDHQEPANLIWKKGQSVEISGYSVSPELANGLAEARLLPIGHADAHGSKLIWIEVSSHPVPKLNPASEKTLSQWKENGWHIKAKVVHGPAFWQNISDANAPELWSYTNDTMESIFKKEDAGV